MNALQRLIKARMAELDLTFYEVGRRGGMPHTTAWTLASKAEHRQIPRIKTLKALSKGLDLPLDVVRVAAAEAAGIRIEEITLDSGSTLATAENIRVVAAVMGKLSQKDQEKLRRLAISFVDEVDDK